MTNLTQKEEKEFDELINNNRIMVAFGNMKDFKEVFNIFLSQKKAEWQDEVIEALPITGNETFYESDCSYYNDFSENLKILKQNLKSQFKGKETND